MKDILTISSADEPDSPVNYKNGVKKKILTDSAKPNKEKTSSNDMKLEFILENISERTSFIRCNGGHEYRAYFMEVMNWYSQKFVSLMHLNSPFLDIILGVLIFVFAIGISMIITLWPQHDGILYPEYWYEPIAPIVLGYIMIVSATNIIECYLVMKYDLILRWKAFFQIFLATASSFSMPYVVAYVLWVYGLAYRHPMPFIGQLCALIQSIVRPIAFWFLFPSSLRIHDKEFRKRLVAFTTLFPLRFIMAIVYTRIASTVTTLPHNIQWCVAIFLPFLKKFNFWWTTKIGYKASGCVDLSAKLSMICAVTCTHSFVLTFILGSNIAPQTAYLIMVAEFICNTWDCIKIVKLHRQNSLLSKEQETEALKCLTLKEYLEVLIPAIYCVAFTIAYYGPNADILGNVRNDYWQFEKVENLLGKLNNIGIFFAIDVCRGVLFVISLWNFCKLNMLIMFGQIIRRFGFLILFWSSICLSGVSNLHSHE